MSIMRRSRRTTSWKDKSAPAVARSELDTVVFDFQQMQIDRKEASKLQRFIDKTAPLVNVMRRYSRAAEIASNACPEILCPLWAPLWCLLDVAKKFEEYFSSLADMLQHIADVLPQLEKYESLFGGHEDLHTAVTNMYSAITSFVSHADKVFSRSSTKILVASAWQTFEEVFDASLSQLRHCREQVEREVFIAHMTEEANARAQLDRALEELSCLRREVISLKKELHDQQAPDLGDVREWLSARQCHQEKGILNRMDGSCEWITVRSEVTRWVERDDTRLLWLYGPPGCGKTYIYSKLLDHIEQDLSQRHIFFLFCKADKNRISVTSLLRAWLAQLVKLIWVKGDSPAAMQCVTDKMADRSGPKATEEEIEILFLSLLDITDLPSVVFTVDALDECSDRKAFYAMLPKITKRFKLLVTSQDLADFQDQLPYLEKPLETLDIRPEMTQGDVDRYIDQEVETLQTEHGGTLSDHIKSLIRDKLRKESKGMILWTSLMLEHMRAQTTPDIVRCLEDLPATLTERYDRIMKDINDLPRPQRLLAHRVFFWVLVASRPLSIRELGAALAVRPAESREMAPTEYRPVPEAELRQSVLHVCRFLVKPRDTEGFLYPVHGSVTKYLEKYMEDTERLLEVASSYQVPQVSSANSLAAAICMRYLSSDIVGSLQHRVPLSSAAAGEMMASADGKFGLLDYAVRHWFQHARDVDTSDELVLRVAEDFLDDTRPNANLVWQQHWLSTSTRGCQARQPPKFSGLQIAAYFGLQRIADGILQSQDPISPDTPSS